MRTFSPRNVLPPLFLVFLLSLAVMIYWPGLQGGFLFDDFPNLQELGSYGGVVDFETFKNFVFHGVASPLGRPLALASFLLDDNTWPASPESFKVTNLKIHLLTGLFLCWATLNLMRLFRRSDEECIWIALIGSAVWLLHPYMVSTTLYVVQRMAQLAAMFVFAGLAGYFYGRRLLIAGRVVPAYAWMSCSLSLGTLLALASKENGVLLPMLVLVIHACLPGQLVVPKLWWRLLFLWAPSAVVMVMLAREINFSPDAWPNRLFTQPERLLTEPRILWEYLNQLYVPRIEGRGLFQDGYEISRGFLSPLSTLISLLALVLLIFAAVFYRRRFPLFSLSILFYFTAHLLESTVVGLELYFEHRNYLSSAFLFLPIVAALVDLRKKIHSAIVYFAIFSLLVLLALLTFQRSLLWSNTARLELYWAVATPESPRAQNRMATLLLDEGRVDESINLMTKSVDRFPTSSLLTVNLLLLKIYAVRAEETDFIECAEKMRLQPFDAQAVAGLRSLVDRVIKKSAAHQQYLVYTLSLLDEVQKNPAYNHFHLFNKLVPYLKAEIYLAQLDYDQAYRHYSMAIPMYNDTDAALSMVAEMANADRPVEALLLLKQTEFVYKNQPDATLKRSRHLYDFELARMHKLLLENLKNIGVDTVIENGSTGEEKNNAEHSHSSQK